MMFYKQLNNNKPDEKNGSKMPLDAEKMKLHNNQKQFVFIKLCQSKT